MERRHLIHTALPAALGLALARVGLSTRPVVAIFAEPGYCGRIAVPSVVQNGKTLAVRLVLRPLAPGTMDGMAIHATHRLLSTPTPALRRPFPTRATVTLA